ncbi:MAG: aldo/keto reductase [Bifidobacteriaceae bacterium]|jgi:2,5-diketo-D-gluconate reductase A|nr:aldo/keto reductase [Bifidobacteriaceae bacterium]
MAIPDFQLNSGHRIPALGLGTYKMAPGVTADLVDRALRLGYRHIDTAAFYGNEAEVGQGLRRSGVAREDVFVTTKLWNDAHAHDAALRAFDQSLGQLGLDYVDLYLIHWPAPDDGLMVEAWRALVEISQSGRARSIGVSNFRVEDLAAVIDATGVVPAVNQVELHPLHQQPDLRAANAELGIVTEAWSPLGRGGDLSDGTVRAVAHQVGKTPAQVVLRWLIQLGVAVFPKTVRPERLAENLALDGFELAPEQMERLNAIRPAPPVGPEPADVH